MPWADAEDLSGIRSFTASISEVSPWTYVIVYTATDRSGLKNVVQKTLERSRFGEIQGVIDRDVSDVSDAREKGRQPAALPTFLGKTYK